jgi:hypothetical protein
VITHGWSGLNIPLPRRGCQHDAAMQQHSPFNILSALLQFSFS